MPNENEDEEKNYDLGVQPVDSLLVSLGLENRDLVDASRRGLTFKMVQKARKGRRLTTNVQHKVLAAIRSLKPEREWTLKDLFTY